MSNLPDAAYIRNLRNSGYRDGKDPTYPVCPICEQTCDTIYISADNELSLIHISEPTRPY